MSKTILITGGSRGIGRAVAVLAGKRGWNAGINFAGNEKAASEAVAAVEAAGGKAIAIQGDVADEKAVIAMFAKTIAAFGPISGLVNNAGVVMPASKVIDMETERLRRIFEINVFGAFIVAREGARRMAKSKGGAGGSIVNLSSVAARLGGPNEFADYAASKGAIDSMTLGLARELGPEGIRVNAVCPGLIDTEIHAGAGLPDRAVRLGPGVPLGRAGTAEEVAQSIIWLLGDESSYVSGALIDVSGGR